MLNGTHAALRPARIETQSADIKSRDGLTVFGEELTRTKRGDADLDKTLSRTPLHQVAVCIAEPLEMDKARGTVEKAEALVGVIRSVIARPKS